MINQRQLIKLVKELTNGVDLNGLTIENDAQKLVIAIKKQFTPAVNPPPVHQDPFAGGRSSFGVDPVEEDPKKDGVDGQPGLVGDPGIDVSNGTGWTNATGPSNIPQTNGTKGLIPEDELDGLTRPDGGAPNV